MSDEAVQIAILRTEVDHLRAHLSEMREDLKEIKSTLTEARGGWKTLMLVAGISSSVGAMLVKFTPWFVMAPK